MLELRIVETIHTSVLHWDGRDDLHESSCSPYTVGHKEVWLDGVRCAYDAMRGFCLPASAEQEALALGWRVAERSWHAGVLTHIRVFP